MEVPTKSARSLELRKGKDENTLNQECDKMNNLRKEEIKPLGTRIYSLGTNSEGRDYSLG